MTSTIQVPHPTASAMPAASSQRKQVFRFLGSLKLAVLLLPTLAGVLAWATIIEAQSGAAVARWQVYESRWFIGLLALLGVNIFCAAATRYPWKRHQTGFVVTHCGLLVLLAGSIQSFLGGVEGRVTLVEGESTDHMVHSRLSQVTSFWVGRPQEPPYEFMFDAGPVDWRQGQSLDIGEVDGVRARVLGFLRHPKAVEEWVPDETKMGGPVVKFKLIGQDGKKVTEGALVDQKFGDAVSLGPLRLQLERAVSDRMLQDFVQPPVDKLGEQGLLAMYYGDAVEHASLDTQLGQRIPLGATGVVVELVECFPNANPDKMGQFVTKGDLPKNPMVELRVHLPDDDKPLRQIAFAKDALLNLDGVYPRMCPVKFRYYHPAIQPQNAFELLQTSDGKLFGRTCSDGTHTSHGEVKPGRKFTLPGKFQLEVVDYLPHGRQVVSFLAEEAATARKSADKSEPAALIEIRAGGRTEQVWLRRNDPVHGRRTIETPAGAMVLNYEYGKLPLGFSLTLLDFRRDTNPGDAGNASFASRVQVSDPIRGEDREAAISMNEPLTQGKYTFYQSGFDQAGHGKEKSSFSVAHDPGRFLKYSGSLMICLGIAIMFYMRAYFFQPRRKSARSVSASLAVVRSSLIFAIVAATCLGTAQAEERFDWDAWRSLPVQNGGRQKPLDTLAWETLRTLANRGSQVDPETQERLSPIACYLSMLFDWQGWENADRSQLELVTDWRPMYFHLHKADKWDQTPLLRVDFPPLRKALGVTVGNHITPWQLADCKLADRKSDREIPFSTWAEQLLTAEESGQALTEFEKKGLELADRLWSYQLFRMGRTLEVLPAKGNEELKWVPLAHLLLSTFDDSTDATGELRQAQTLFLQARQAFHDHDVATFNSASREFVALLRRLGPEAGSYLSPRAVAWEVAYNRWAPFRFAWSFMLVASLGVLLHSGTGWKWFDRLATVSYVAGLVAIGIGFGMRIAISGRPPVTNMYESMIYVGAGVALFGGLFELIYRNRLILAAAATVATVVLVLADNCPLLLDPSVRPLEPVLRSNFWLVTHVMTITLSYAALALAMGIANITLGFYLVGADRPVVLGSLSRFTYKAIQLGVLLLSAGIILGGVWADYSWGRFWGWDPKEVWALVALLGYLAVLHARFAGWVGHRGLAALSIGCFSLVVMAWYGVNFVLGAGLHSYGFGGGGQGYVYSAVILQLLYVATALLRTSPDDDDEESAEPLLGEPTSRQGISPT